MLDPNIQRIYSFPIAKQSNTMYREHNKPVFLPSAVPQQPQNTVKSTVGDKRTQKRQGAEGSLDPFMMTTMQGDYNPTIRNKPKQAEAAPVFDPMTGSYHSSAPGTEQIPIIML